MSPLQSGSLVAERQGGGAPGETDANQYLKRRGRRRRASRHIRDTGDKRLFEEEGHRGAEHQ